MAKEDTCRADMKILRINSGSKGHLRVPPAVKKHGQPAPRHRLTMRLFSTFRLNYNDA